MFQGRLLQNLIGKSDQKILEIIPKLQMENNQIINPKHYLFYIMSSNNGEVFIIIFLQINFRE